MDGMGLIWKFKVNRELTRPERRDHLPVDKASCASPGSQMSVIRMNSTWLECVDKFYFGKGEITGGGIFGMIIMGGFMILPVHWMFFDFPVASEHERSELLLGSIAILAMVLPTMLLVWFTYLGKEVFRYTHYPIRFNRKTRMVHVFRLDGTVMSESWDKLYFTLGVGEELNKQREVRAHRLSEDGKETVLETFALPTLNSQDHPRAQWEFVRRYMETGPAEVLPLIDHVLDGHFGRNESFGHGYKMIAADAGKFITIVFLPMSLLYAIGRWIAMRTCKQPVWPAEVEAESAIDPDDPYLVDADHVPKQAREDDAWEEEEEDLLREASPDTSGTETCRTKDEPEAG